MTYTIYHNPNCSKSRETLEILKSKVSDVRVVEYLKNPPDEKELKDIITNTSYAASKDDLKPVLQGVLFQIQNSPS